MLERTLVIAASVAVIAAGGSAAAQSHSQHLAEGYADFATFENERMWDFGSAGLFERRASAVTNGQAVEPADPREFGIADESIVAARSELMETIRGGGAEAAPRDAAMAQVNFDCWMEQLGEGWQWQHIKGCRDAFLGHLASMQAALEPEEPAVLAAEAEMVPMSDFAERVYFDFDEASLRPEAAAAIDEFVASLQENERARIYVEGHADRSGPVDYNERLSAARADRVKESLLDRGMRLVSEEDIETVAKGELDPAVPTEDGVRLQENRFVLMQAYEPGQPRPEPEQSRMSMVDRSR